jgi:restriction system protein
MAVPDYESLMLPILEVLADGREWPVAESRSVVSKKLGLSQSDLAELLPSGKQGRFANRLSWAQGYLKEAGLLRSVRHGVYQITDRGKSALKECDGRIDNAFLTRYPEFLEFRSRSNRPETAPASNAISDVVTEYRPSAQSTADLTPDEMVREGYVRARRRVAGELLERVMRASPSFFEELVIDVLVAMGYGGSYADAASVVGQSGDGGIDGIIKEDRLGLESIYVQAKRWKEGSVVGRPDIQQFAGALQGQRARKGVFITTSRYTKEALEYARAVQATIVLIDGQQLADLMLEHEVGVSVKEALKLYRLDEDYFVEE